MPLVHRYIPSAAPRSTTLVSPPTISTPAARAAAAIASISARRTAASSPSSRIIETVSASGLAPAIARSLTVPLTASSPILPPGTRSGLTTKLSVVIARRIAADLDRAGIGERRQRTAVGAASAGTSRPSIRVWVALPPAPCASVIFSSRKRGRLERAVSMIASTRCSRPVATDSLTRLRSADAVCHGGHHTACRSRAYRPKL